MSERFDPASAGPVTSAFFASDRRPVRDVWADAGSALEMAHRARLPIGWAEWAAIALLLVAVGVACI